jgi:hypothetical protein
MTVTAMNETRVDALSRALHASGSRRVTLVVSLLAALGLREHINVRAGKSKRKNKKEQGREQHCQRFVRGQCDSLFPANTAYNSACYGFFASVTPALGADCCAVARKSPPAAAACLADHRVRYCEILVSGSTCPGDRSSDIYRSCVNRLLPCCQLASTSMGSALQCVCPDCTFWPIAQ